jgi:hypothetical protein
LSWILLFTERYNGRAARFLRRHPELRDAYRNTLCYWRSTRITLEALIDGQRLIPIDIGSHDAVCRG